MIYPNVHFRTVGQEEAERDIAECRALAEAAGATGTQDRGARGAARTFGGASIGAAGGAATGAIAGVSAVPGAAIGAVGGAVAGLTWFLSLLLDPAWPGGTHRAFVNRCLGERGYEPIGWE